MYDLSAHQWEILDRGVAFYQQCVPVIRSGKSRRYGREDQDYNHLKGWQGLVREGIRDAEGWCLAVLHRFESTENTFSVPLPGGSWRIEGICGEPETEVRIELNRLWIQTGGDYSAAAVLLKRVSEQPATRQS